MGLSAKSYAVTYQALHFVYETDNMDMSTVPQEVPRLDGGDDEHRTGSEDRKSNSDAIYRRGYKSHRPRGGPMKYLLIGAALLAALQIGIHHGRELGYSQGWSDAHCGRGQDCEAGQE